MTGKSGQRRLISSSKCSPSMPGMLMSDRITISSGRMPSVSFFSASSPDCGEMQRIDALAHLAAKALAEQLDDIRLVIDHQDADGHAVLPRPSGRRRPAAAAAGSLNSVNSPGALSTSIVPPCCWVTMS